MSRYGVAVYGEDTYGVEGAGTTLLWGLDIAWQTEGVYTGTNYAQYMTNCTWSRGRRQYLNQGGKGISMPEVGRCTIELDNDTGIFTPTNTSGSLYPYIVPGAYAKLRVRNGEAGTIYNVFAGKVISIEPLWGGLNPKVQVVMEDGWRLLNDSDVNITYAANTTSSVAVASVLTAADWPDIWGTDIETGDYQIKYFGARDKRADEVLKDIVNYEFGRTAVAGDGKFLYRKKVQAETTAAIAFSQTDMLKDVQITQRYDSIRNCAKVKVTAYKAAPPQSSMGPPDPIEVWTMDDTPYFTSHDSLNVYGEFEYQNHHFIASSLTTLEATTDYQANANEAGDGTDRTGQFQITVTGYADRARYEIYNAGTNAAYLTKLQQRAFGYFSPDPTWIEKDESTTVRRVVEIDSPYMQTMAKGKTQAEYILDVTASEILPKFQLEAQPSKQFAFDLLDQVTVDIPAHGIARQRYFVAAIDGQWLTDNGQAVLTTVTLETAKEGGIA